MPGATLRVKRNVASPQSHVLAESEFHLMRMQEQLRTRAMKDFGATEQQVAPSYFAESLQDLCARRLAETFEENTDIDKLREEEPELYEMVLERLPTQPETMLPLHVSVARITDEKFWRRCCKARWPLGHLSRIATGENLQTKEYGWKRLFLEQVLCDFLMSLGSGCTAGDAEDSLLPPSGSAALAGDVTALAQRLPPHAPHEITCTPQDGDASRFDLSRDDEAAAILRELCVICRDYVRSIDLPCQLVHFRFYEHLFAHIPGIQSFRLTYGVANRGVRVGVTDMIGFHDDDAQQINQLLRHYAALESLRLPHNRLEDRHAQMIAAGLVNTTLRVLDFSQNSLTDTAVVKAVSLLLCRPDFLLEELYLADNKLADAAAVALAESLHYNKTLRVLHLQHNCIGDATGGASLIHAFATHPTLREVNLGCNHLGICAAKALCQVLPELTQLRVLCLSGNTRFAGNTVMTDAAATTGVTAATASTTPVPLDAITPKSSRKAANSTTANLPSPSATDTMATSTKESTGEMEDTVAASAADAAGVEESAMVGEENISLTTAYAATGEAYRESATARPSMTIFTEEESENATEPRRGAAREESEVRLFRPLPLSATELVPRTEGGILLVGAVHANTSLVEFDVRHCGLTPSEEKSTMQAVRERVYRMQMETTVAASAAEKSQLLRRRAEEKVARMAGRRV